MSKVKKWRKLRDDEWLTSPQSRHDSDDDGGSDNYSFHAGSYTETSEPIDTPTHTTAQSDSTIADDAYCNMPPKSPSIFTISDGYGSVPEPGKTYMIRDIESGKALALMGRRLTVIADAGTRGGWHWHCEERDDGWVGFREAVSGNYLGHDNNGGYTAIAATMKAWEYFVLRPRESGGYNLCVKHWSGFKHMRISSEGDVPSIVDAPSFKEATRWEFVAVGW